MRLNHIPVLAWTTGGRFPIESLQDGVGPGACLPTANTSSASPALQHGWTVTDVQQVQVVLSCQSSTTCPVLGCLPETCVSGQIFCILPVGLVKDWVVIFPTALDNDESKSY